MKRVKRRGKENYKRKGRGGKGQGDEKGNELQGKEWERETR